MVITIIFVPSSTSEVCNYLEVITIDFIYSQIKEEYRIPLLQILEENNGSVPAVEVLKQLERKLAERLNDTDYEMLASNQQRWFKNANWTRFELVRDGLMRKDSRRGIWEISDVGRRFLENHQQ